MKTKTFAAVVALVLAAPLAATAGTPSPSRSAFAGAVTSASSSSITVDVLWSKKGNASGSVTVGIDPSTKIVYGKGKSSIATGDLVRVVAAGSTAKRIHVDCNCHVAGGTVASVSGGSIAVQVDRSGPYDTALKGNTVTFQLGGATAPQVGDKVGIGFSANGFFKDPSFDWQTATFTINRLRVRSH